MSVYQHYEAIALAAKHGDPEAAWTLATYHRDRCHFPMVRDAHTPELECLAIGVRAGDPRALWRLGVKQMTGAGYLKPLVLQGATLLAQSVRQRIRYRPVLNVRDRLLALGDVSKRAALLAQSERTKFPFVNHEGVATQCAIRINYRSAGDCHMVLEQLSHHRTRTSVTNAIETLCTLALYRCLLAGIDIDPERVTWYEAYPARWPEPGRLHGVRLQWDGRVYSEPEWYGVDPEATGIDLSDILTSEARYG
jgi:hypothetical protein